LPDTRIVSIINTDLKPEIAEGFKTAGREMGIDTVELQNVGKTAGHPNIAGMMDIKEQILNFFKT